MARVEFGAEEDRSVFRANGLDAVGIGIVKQSTANVVQVAKEARARAAEVIKSLPDDMNLVVNFDGSTFVNAAINEVFITLGIAVALVVGVIFVFLGSFRATLIPAVTVPISLIASFTVLLALGLSVNMLTLLALVMAIGLVVDDAIVVLENIHRRIEELGETPLVAAYRGTRQVGFAVVATTMVLIAVFVPITFMQGQVGRLFTEFAIAIAAAIAFSMLVALTISPMMASKLLKPHDTSDKPKKGFGYRVDQAFGGLRRGYAAVYDATVRRPIAIAIAFFAIIAGTAFLFTAIPGEYTPNEDRGMFMVSVSGPEGASFEYMQPFVEQIEARLLPMVQGWRDRRHFGAGAGRLRRREQRVQQRIDPGRSHRLGPSSQRLRDPERGQPQALAIFRACAHSPTCLPASAAVAAATTSRSTSSSRDRPTRRWSSGGTSSSTRSTPTILASTRSTGTTRKRSSSSASPSITRAHPTWA